MSVLVQKEDEIYIFTKGADDIIWKNLKESERSKKLQQNVIQ